ncbi:MAG: VOC family protein [Alphaproteobacteria bacterium]
MNEQVKPHANRVHNGDVACRGVHHLALNTDDMKMTTEFYVDVLGMPLVHAMKVPHGLGTGPNNRGNPPYEDLRHYFFDMGNDSLLAFFEMPKGAEPKAKRDALAGMQHCAFSVTVERFEDLQRRMKKHGIAFTGPLDIMPGLRSIYFFDPNGVRLEACVQPAGGDNPTVIRSVLQTKHDAGKELATLPGVSQEWIEKMTAALEAK